VTREGLKDAPHVRAFNDFIVSRVGTLKHVLHGRPLPRAAEPANERDRAAT
jgi:hypothetical protein